MANRSFVPIHSNRISRLGFESLQYPLDSGLDLQGETSRELWVLGRFSL